MELTIFTFLANFLVFAGIVLLRYYRLIGLLATSYAIVWTMTIFALLVFSPQSVAYLTYKGLGLIYTHLLCLVVAAGFSYQSISQVRYFTGFLIRPGTLFYVTFLIAALGLGLILYTIDIWAFYIQNQLANLRGELFEQTIVINRYFKLMGNMTYPLAMIAALYYYQRSKQWWILALAVLLGGLLSLASAGKGNLLMVMILLGGGILFMALQRGLGFPSNLKKLGIVLAVGLLIFFYFIGITRLVEGEEFSIYDNLVLINEYFSSSIPAFCVWLESNDLPLINLEFGQFALLRELGGMVGLDQVRTIDHQVVHIPHPFNVYTALADSISAFGYVGSLIYYILIGWVIGMLDVRPRDNQPIFLFATFFLFVVYSLFTDVFFYMIGSWICLAFHFMFRISTDPVSLNQQKPMSQREG